MKERWWIAFLVVFSILTVVSVVNVTHFAVTGFQIQEGDEESFGGDTPFGTDRGPIISFPNSGDNGGVPQSSDDPVAGEEDSGESSGDGEEIIEEFHSESTQNLCVIVEGPGEDTCADSVDCVVCGDGICQSDVEDEVTCSEDCSAIEEDSEDPLPEESNPALGEQGDLSDEDYQTYLDNSFSTCTNNFGLCVRIPKVTGLESNICGPSVTCEELKQKFEERALRENIQLAPNLENSLVLRFLRAFFGR